MGINVPSHETMHSVLSSIWDNVPSQGHPNCGPYWISAGPFGRLCWSDPKLDSFSEYWEFLDKFLIWGLSRGQRGATANVGSSDKCCGWWERKGRCSVPSQRSKFWGCLGHPATYLATRLQEGIKKKSLQEMPYQICAGIQHDIFSSSWPASRHRLHHWCLLCTWAPFLGGKKRKRRKKEIYHLALFFWKTCSPVFQFLAPTGVIAAVFS